MLDRRLVESAAHVIVADIESPVLDPDDAHHLFRVLRLRSGEAITMTDGQGHWRPGVAGDQTIEPTDETIVVERPRPELAVGFALTKGDRPEWVVQKLTEIGIDRIEPFIAERSVVKWDETKAERNVARWRKVAREALMQCRGVQLPEVASVSSFSVLAAREASTAVRADMDGLPLTLERPFVLIGAEGGWSAQEQAALPAVDLGERVLRAETAALVAGSRLVQLRSGR